MNDIYHRLKEKRCLIHFVKRFVLFTPRALLPIFVWASRFHASYSIWKNANGRILYGPFTGMTIDANAFLGGTDSGSKILGFYEQEVLEELNQSRNRRNMINVGAADGYYSIGWAITIENGAKEESKTKSNGRGREDSHVIAFESLPEGRNAIKRNAKRNLVEQKIEIRGTATQQELLSIKFANDLSFRKTIILCDIEGAEYKILSKEVFNHFRDAKWIIELHELDDEMYEEKENFVKMVKKIKSSRLIETSSRNPGNFSELDAVGDSVRWLLCSEGRERFPGKWLVAE